MPFPQFPKQYDQEVIITPGKHFLAEKEEYMDYHPPQSVILCFESSLMNHYRAAADTSHRSFWSGEMIYFEDLNQEVALVGNFGIGGPAAGQILEILIAAGTHNFIVVGHAGGLQSSNPVGTIVITDKAIRDEGLSHHYLPPNQAAFPSKRLTEQLKNNLEQQGIDYNIGSTWTLDSMYRETREEIQHYAHAGVATVEMELASLFAVAAFRKVDIASLLVISDYVGLDEWEQHFHAKPAKTALFNTVEVAKVVLRS